MYFYRAWQVTRLVDDYFTHIAGAFHYEEIASKSKTEDTHQKIWDREPEPPTFSGLALHLGFNSLEEFNEYEKKGKYARLIKRAKLRIIAEYEKRLHLSSPSGAIFALKALEGTDTEQTIAMLDTSPKLQIEILDNGIDVAANERDVKL